MSTSTEPVAGDRLIVKNLERTEASLVLFRLSTGSGHPTVSVGATDAAGGLNLVNLESDSLPAGQMAVYSHERAFALRRIRWTAHTEHRTVSLRPPLALPVKVWISRPLQDLDANVPISTQAAAEVDRAMTVFAETGLGLTIDLSQRTKGSAAIAAASSPDLKQLWRIGYAAGHLNVYYVDQVDDIIDQRGWTDQHYDNGKVRNSIVIYPGASLETLAHEIGHALRLSVDLESRLETTWDDGNLMSDGQCRRWLTLGQAYRANVARDSAVNRLRLRHFQQEFHHPKRDFPSAEFDCPRPWATGTQAARQVGRSGVSAVSGRRRRPSREAPDHRLGRWLNADRVTERQLLGLLATGSRQMEALSAVLTDGPSREDMAALERHLAATCALGRPARERDALFAMYKRRLDQGQRARAALVVHRLAVTGSRRARLLLGDMAHRPISPRLGHLIARLQALHEPVRVRSHW